MVLIACAAVNVPVHKGLFLHIQFPDAVENDMDMDIAAFIVAIGVRTDDYLMSWEMLAGKFQSECMRLLCGQLPVFAVLWIEADAI